MAVEVAVKVGTATEVQVWDLVAMVVLDLVAMEVALVESVQYRSRPAPKTRRLQQNSRTPLAVH